MHGRVDWRLDWRLDWLGRFSGLVVGRSFFRALLLARPQKWWEFRLQLPKNERNIPLSQFT
jgi:hypothetical protein